MNGVILLHKPAGITSFQALGTLKKKLMTGRVGHAGTLDRFASGLLIAAAGNYTRLLFLFTAAAKDYRAEVMFGQGTDTLDPEGAINAEGPLPDGDILKAALSGFRGRIMQRPPAYSAVHVNGVRAWRAARQGAAVEPAARPVIVHELELESYTPPVARLRVVCSKGTYIRSLARDIALALGTCAHLSALTRVRIGDFSLAEAVPPEEFDPGRHLLTAGDLVRRINGAGVRTVRTGRAGHFRSGKKLSPELFDRNPEEGTTIVLDEGGSLLAVVKRQGENLTYVMTAAE